MSLEKKIYWLLVVFFLSKKWCNKGVAITQIYSEKEKIQNKEGCGRH